MDSDSERIQKDRRLLLLATLLSFALAATEVVGGYLSGSLSLLGDALHLTADIAGYLVGMVGLSWCLRPPTPTMSFGYDRAESLAALLSLLLIWLMSGFLVESAVSRFRQPQPIHSLPMLLVAAIGLLGNILLAFVIHKASHHRIISSEDRIHSSEEHEEVHFFDNHNHHHGAISPNLQAALIHALGDCLQSGSVLLGALLLHVRPSWLWMDPLCTLLSAAFILVGSLPLWFETIRVFMEASPFTTAELNALKECLSRIDRVASISELHVWTLGHFRNCLSAKVCIEKSKGMNDDMEIMQLLEKCELEIKRKHPSIKFVNLQPYLKN